MIFASFHQGKEEKYIAFLCIPTGLLLSPNYLASKMLAWIRRGIMIYVLNPTAGRSP